MQLRIPVVEEQLQVSARTVDTGGVRVHKQVEHYERSVDTVRWAEQLDIQAVPVNRIVAPDEVPSVRYEDQTLVVPVLEEMLVVEKKVVIREEIRITRSRRAVHETKQVPLRREQVSIERLPASVSRSAGESAQNQSGGAAAPPVYSDRRRNMATVVAVFDNYGAAEDARNELVQSGIPNEDVKITQSEASGAQVSHLSDDEGTDGSFGERVAHFFRSLFGSHDDEEHVGHYAEAVRRGSSVVTAVVPDARTEAVSEILRRHDAVDIHDRAEQWRSRGWTGYEPSAQALSEDELAREREHNVAATESETLPVVEEELKVGKRQVQRGGVRVFTHTTERPVEEQVTLREERANVERRPVDRPATDADLAAFKEGSIEVRETTEEPVTSKTARVVEEVVVGKEVRERTETVGDVVRRTDVEVEQLEGEQAGQSRAPDEGDPSEPRRTRAPR
jgi:uncharacterized protein (TIGR02271 family)